jgi:4-hydroxy-tetrahydrodipicolinate synthase
MIDLLFADGNPAGIKAMLNTLGLCNNTLRLPLVAAGRTTIARIQKAIEEINSN